MSGIIIAVAIVVGIGLIASVGLVFASKFMSVPVDEKAAGIEKLLPGANCGACGFSGCSGYAAAISNEGAKTNLCSVGGNEVAKKISGFLGVEAEEAEKKISVVFCGGSKECREKKADYSGITSCKSVAALFGSDSMCAYGCIGLGDCASACEYGGISIINGVAVINRSVCVACGKCISVCPKKLIRTVPDNGAAAVLCSSRDSGAATRKACKNGCIACKMCVKACPSAAIEIIDNHAVIDASKCTHCGACREACKVGCIVKFVGIGACACPQDK